MSNADQDATAGDATVKVVGGKSGLVLAQAAIGTLLVMFDFNAPLATLSATARSLDASTQAQTWMLAGMSLGLASSLMLAGSLGDAFGRRRIFLAGLAILVASTVAAALAVEGWTFVAARIAQGLAGGAVIACGLALIAHAFPGGSERRRATGIWGASLGMGIAVGPLLAAWVAAIATWRTVYFLEAMLATLLLLWALRLRETPRSASGHVDIPGALTFVVAMALITGGLIECRQGWTRLQAVGPLIAGVAAAAGFVRLELHRPDPLMDVRLFRSRGFIAATTGALVTGVAIIGFMSYLPTVLQRGLGESPTVSACALALWSGVSALISLLARRLPLRLSGGSQLTGGLFLCAVGLAALCGISARSSWLDLVPGLVIVGIGGGVLNAALARLAIESVPAHRAGMGSGANNTARYLGSSAGVAIVVAVVAARGSAVGNESSADVVTGMGSAALVSAGIALLGAVVTALSCREAAGTRARVARPGPRHMVDSRRADTQEGR